VQRGACDLSSDLSYEQHGPQTDPGHAPQQHSHLHVSIDPKLAAHLTEELQAETACIQQLKDCSLERKNYAFSASMRAVYGHMQCVQLTVTWGQCGI